MLENYQENKLIQFDSAFLYNNERFHCKCIVNFYSKTTDFTIFSYSGINNIGGILPFVCLDIIERQKYIIKSIDSHFKLMQYQKNIPLSNDVPLLPF